MENKENTINIFSIKVESEEEEYKDPIWEELNLPVEDVLEQWCSAGENINAAGWVPNIQELAHQGESDHPGSSKESNMFQRLPLTAPVLDDSAVAGSSQGNALIHPLVLIQPTSNQNNNIIPDQDIEENNKIEIEQDKKMIINNNIKKLLMEITNNETMDSTISGIGNVNHSNIIRIINKRNKHIEMCIKCYFNISQDKEPEGYKCSVTHTICPQGTQNLIPCPLCGNNMRRTYPAHSCNNCRFYCLVNGIPSEEREITLASPAIELTSNERDPSKKKRKGHPCK